MLAMFNFRTFGAPSVDQSGKVRVNIFCRVTGVVSIVRHCGSIHSLRAHDCLIHEEGGLFL